MCYFILKYSVLLRVYFAQDTKTQGNDQGRNGPLRNTHWEQLFCNERVVGSTAIILTSTYNRSTEFGEEFSCNVEKRMGG